MLVLILALGLHAEAETPPSFEVDVSRVEVDVLVFDRDGHFVDGLSRDDFEVREDGTKVDIIDFELRALVSAAVLSSTEAKEVAAPEFSPAIEPRKFILFADLMSSSARAVHRAQRELRAFVEQVMLPGDEMMIALLDPGSRLLVFEQFTASRERLLPKLDALRGNAQLDRYRQDQRERMLQAMQAGEAGVNIAKALAREAAGGQQRRAEQSLNALASLVELVEQRGWQTGRKIVLYLSEGEALSAGQEWFDFYNKLADGKERSDYTMEPLLRRTASRLNLARATVYALSTRGTFSAGLGADSFGPSVLSAGEEMAAYYDSQSSLSSVASDTGGLSFVNRETWTGAFREIETDNRLGYVLTYSPPQHQKRDKPVFHRIEVRCKRPHTKVRARKGYLD